MLIDIAILYILLQINAPIWVLIIAALALSIDLGDLVYSIIEVFYESD